MAYPTITALPTPPSRQRPSDFANEADAFLGALPDFRTETNTAGEFIETKAGEALTSANNAATSETNAATSETNAAASASAAAADAAQIDVFGDLFLGSKASDPSLDNDGDALQTGAIYYNTTLSQLKVYDGAAWQTAVFNVDATGALLTVNNLSDLANTDVAIQNLGITATATELNLLDGATVTTAGLNLLDGATVTTAEINYNDIAALGTSEASKVVTADANGNIKLSEEVQATAYLETVVALSGTSVTVDCDEANTFTLTTSGNTTFTFDYSGVNLTTDDSYGFTLKVTAGGTHTLTWPASVDWPGGSAPDAPADTETDVFVFFTTDGGTNWYGFQAGDALA